MIFSDEGIRRLEHIADGKPVPKDEIDRRLAWDKPLTISVPQDPKGAFRKNETGSIWSLVLHVKRHTASAEMRVLAAGIEACIEELTKLTTKPIEPDGFRAAARDLDAEERLRRKNSQQGFSSLRGAFFESDDD